MIITSTTQAMAGPDFSCLWNPYPTYPGGVHNFYGCLYPGQGRSYGGFPDFGYLDPFRPQAPHQQFGAQGGNFGPLSLVFSLSGPSCYDCYRQHYSGVVYQQTRRAHCHTLLRLVVELFLCLQTQEIAIRARHVPGCLNVIADYLSLPNQPIITEWSLHP